ncbi:MAG: hypothetical protein K2Q26_00660 [Bdellovibrionales bacterium]|nr:hypothetical protein [Bdellovibrionales bacterium]
MRIPKNRCSTTISSMILRQIPNFEQFYKSSFVDCGCFLDYFSVHTNSLDMAFLDNNCILVKNKVICNGYKKARLYQDAGGLRFIIGKDCHYDSPWAFKIQFNPKMMTSFVEFESFLRSVMGHVDESNHCVARLDIAYLLKEDVVSPQLLHYTTHLKWKNGTSVYNNSRRDFKDGHMTGFSSDGSAVRVSAYAESGKPTGEAAKQGYLKLEIQVRKASLKSAGVKSIYDLNRIYKSGYLKRLQFYNPIWIDKKYRKHVHKFKELQEYILTGGFHNARRLLNKNRNFDRDHRRYLSKLRFDHGRVVFGEALAKKYSDWLRYWLRDMKRAASGAKKEKSWLTVRVDPYI